MMKIKLIYVLLILSFSMLAVTKSFASELGVNTFNKNSIYFECDKGGDCDITTYILKYLETRSNFNDKEFTFYMMENGGLIDSETLGDFLVRMNAIPTTNSDATTYEPSSISSEIMDAALDCKSDTDFSCIDWEANLSANLIMNVLSRMDPLEFVITQEFLDSNNNFANSLAKQIIGASTISGLITAMLVKYTASRLITALVVNSAVSKMADNLIRIDASGGLKAGDRISIDGKGGISVNSQGSGSAGGNNSGGSGHHGGNGGHYTGGSRHVCTGTIGVSMHCYTVYY